MEDRVRLSNGKSSILTCPSTYNPSDFATFLADLKAGLYVDVTPNNSLDANAGVTVVGTALNKANLLTDATAAGFGFQATDNPTVNDVLGRIGTSYISGTLATGNTSLVLVNARIKTTSHYDIYVSKWDAQPTNVSVSNGSMTLTFDPQSENITVDVRVY